MRRLVVLLVSVALVSAVALAFGLRTASRAGTVRERVASIDTIAFNGWSGGLYTVRTDGSRRRLLVRYACCSAWSPDGRQIAFSSHGGIWAVGSDGKGLRRLTTELADSDTHVPCCGMDDDPSWSPDGRRIVFHREWWQDEGTQPVDLYTVDVRTRRLTRLTNSPDLPEFAPAWSPDGRRIAFSDGEAIWTLDLSTSQLAQLTHPSYSNPKIGAPHESPDWSPDGERITYAVETIGGGPSSIAVMRSDGSGSRQIIHSRRHLTDPSWSPDGSGIAYVEWGSGTGADRTPGWLSVARSDGTRSLRLTRDGYGPDWKPRALR